MKTNKIIIAALGVALASVAVNANALTASSATDLTPSLTITGACAVAVSGNTAFASAPSSGTVPVSLSSQIGVVTVSGCTGGSYKLGADAGLNYGITNAATRNLSHGVAADNIAYTLALSGAGTQADWGTAGMTAPTGIATTGGQTAYSRTNKLAADDVYQVIGDTTVPANPVAGVYSDTVKVSVEF